jgi:hypothetical protein
MKIRIIRPMYRKGSSQGMSQEEHHRQAAPPLAASLLKKGLAIAFFMGISITAVLLNKAILGKDQVSAHMVCYEISHKTNALVSMSTAGDGRSVSRCVLDSAWSPARRSSVSPGTLGRLQTPFDSLCARARAYVFFFFLSEGKGYGYARMEA